MQRTDQDMLEGSRLYCQTGRRRRLLQAEPPLVCLSAETKSPDHMTHCTHSKLSKGTWCSRLEVRRRTSQLKLYISVWTHHQLWSARTEQLTTVFLICPIHTVLLQVTPAVQVNTLPTVTVELLGRARAGPQRLLGGHHWFDCAA